MNRMLKLLSDKRGATTIEYAAIASLISLVALASVGSIGTTVLSLFASVPNF
jgi:Flp pilus assembly pilin Flp